MARLRPIRAHEPMSGASLSPRHSSASDGWVAIALLILALLAFAPVFEAEFTLRDDADTVAKNSQMLAGPMQIVRFWSNTRQPNGEIYIPLTQTVWYLLARLAVLPQPTAEGFYFSPLPFHVVNVLLHALNAWLVFRILRQINLGVWPSMAGAVLYLLHPLQVEVVAWVSGLKDVLGGTLMLASLWAFVCCIQAAKKRQRWGAYAVAIAAFVLAMFAKPAATVTPLLAGILGTISLRGIPHETQPPGGSRPAMGTLRRIALLLVPWVLLAIPFAWEARRAQPAGHVPDTPLWQRPLVAGDALAFYLRKLAVPVSLGVDYSRTPAEILRTGAIYWTWILPALLLGGAFAWRRTWPLMMAGVWLFFAAPLPVLGFRKFDFQFYSTVSDRYLYVGMLGAAVAAAAVVAKYASSVRARAITAVALASLGILTCIQAGYWKDDFTLNVHAQDVNPRSLQAASHLGRIYWEQGQADLAIEQYRRAVMIRPQDAPSRRALGNVLLASERFGEAAAEFEAASTADPNDAGLANNLGLSLWKSGRPREARAWFQKAITLDPAYAQPEISLGLLLAEQGDRSDAAAHYRRALQIDPNSLLARRGLDELNIR